MPFRVIRRLAVGGMSEVFLAERDTTGGSVERVVLKRLLPGSGEAARAMFRREREALAAVRSRHVVRMIEGSDDEIVLEYVDGPDLAALLAHLGRQGRTLPLGAAVALFQGVLRGLRDLHQARDQFGAPLGLVHRDLSPSNVLISQAGEVRLTDLGVVHRDLAAETTLPGLKGTLAYMAPEQLRGGRVDARTDLYAAGLIAYEVLTGVPARPAGLSGIAELLHARSTTPAPPSRVRPGLPRDLDRVLLTALDPEPSRRYESAEAMLEAIATAVGVEADPEALGAVAREAVQVFVPVERTLGPEVLGTPQTPRGRWYTRRAVLAAVAAGMLVVAAGVALWEPFSGIKPPDRGVLDSGPPRALVSKEVLEDRDLPVRESDLEGPRIVDAKGSSDRSPARSREDAAPRRLSGVRPRETRAPAGRMLHVSPVASEAIHVTGPGARGLAPLQMPLGSEAVVLTLHVGPAALPIRVRVVPGPGGSAGFIGAPEGRYYQVSCDGRDLGPTPAGPVVLSGRTRCRVETPDGEAASFELGVTAE